MQYQPNINYATAPSEQMLQDSSRLFAALLLYSISILFHWEDSLVWSLLILRNLLFLLEINSPVYTLIPRLGYD